MSFAHIPNFASPAPHSLTATAAPVPFHADPIFAAIEGHGDAWIAYQIAPDGQASAYADHEMSNALDALLATSCATRPGAFALLQHLWWFLDEEAENAEAHGQGWLIAEARARELALLLGAAVPERIGLATPLGRLAGEIARQLPSPLVIDAAPAPAPALVRVGRALSLAGEVVAAVVIVAGGAALVSLATLA